MAFSAPVARIPIAQINVTPLVDVLLVLLVIFMITSPMVTHKLRLDLPHPTFVDKQKPPELVRLSIHADGSMYWNDVPVDRTTLNTQLALAAHRNVPPNLLLDPADGASYQSVASVIADARLQGLDRIDFMAAH